MSHVTTITIITSMLDQNNDWCALLDWFSTTDPDRKVELVKMDLGQSGGTKYPQYEVYMAACNHWSHNIKTLIDKFTAMKTGYLENAVLILEDEHDETFRVYTNQGGEVCWMDKKKYE